ncbi:MAG: PIG-L family deacetylase [Acidobacteriota bacterium]|jgi:LmbE family N-acetylglucosaminyl deacetylase
MTQPRVLPLLDALARKLSGEGILSLEDLPWPRQMRILVLAPHPDDFDAIAITLRFFHERGDSVRLCILSSSASGVEDSFAGRPSAAVKAAIRESEQQTSCRLFGLPDEALVFLRLPEDEAGDPRDDIANYATVRAHVRALVPELLFLPHGNDPNPGHRLAFQMLRRLAAESEFPFVAFLNRDPKTLQMRSDLYSLFSEEGARWKGALLRCHRSQQQRNLNTRGYGFDERILRVNRQAAAEIPRGNGYAEVFEVRSHLEI